MSKEYGNKEHLFVHQVKAMFYIDGLDHFVSLQKAVSCHGHLLVPVESKVTNKLNIHQYGIEMNKSKQSNNYDYNIYNEIWLPFSAINRSRTFIVFEWKLPSFYSLKYILEDAKFVINIESRMKENIDRIDCEISWCMVNSSTDINLVTFDKENEENSMVMDEDEKAENLLDHDNNQWQIIKQKSTDYETLDASSTSGPFEDGVTDKDVGKFQD